MSAPLVSFVRRAVDAPPWLAAVAVGVAITSTVVVAGHRHHTPQLAEPVAAAAAAGAIGATGSTRATRATRTTRPAPQAVRGAHTLQRAERPAAESRPAAASRSAGREAPPEPQLPLAPSDAGETVAAAKSSTVNQPGRCLTWSREQAGIPSRYLDAATAWHYATGRRPGDADPPRGAAVYWTGGSHGYGHIAISIGNGEVRSSDAGGSGRVATIKIDQLTKEWGLQYAGWSDSINGYRIPGVASA